MPNPTKMPSDDPKYLALDALCFLLERRWAGEKISRRDLQTAVFNGRAALAKWGQPPALDAEAVERLEKAIDFVRTLPIDCMGEGKDSGTGETWPLRDELDNNLCSVLAAVRASQGKEKP